MVTATLDRFDFDCHEMFDRPTRGGRFRRNATLRTQYLTPDNFRPRARSNPDAPGGAAWHPPP